MKQLFFKIIFKITSILENEKHRRLIDKMKYCGINVRLDRSVHILVPQEFEIGNNSSISSYTTIYATFGVKIGENCLISSNCGISSYNHVPNSLNRPRDVSKDKNYSKPVTIGNNVWIAMNCCILPGVTIGNNSIIGAGSVVTRNVPENEIWAGNPAKFIKKLS
ncbi:acyltransferase [Pedobacter sp. SL55]|uniref:acyltransferase n=1 Tax=Pedobacter sp. SL55 TaxID=2995161 RepID=UPI002D1E388F|nr:acyltransferase [Pedobacter sp. SL55]